MRTHVFKVELVQEEDARWSAWIDALPGCAAWGHRREEALQAVQDGAEAYIEDMLDSGEEPPQGLATVDAPVVTVMRDAA